MSQNIDAFLDLEIWACEAQRVQWCNFNLHVHCSVMRRYWAIFRKYCRSVREVVDKHINPVSCTLCSFDFVRSSTNAGQRVAHLTSTLRAFRFALIPYPQNIVKADDNRLNLIHFPVCIVSNPRLIVIQA